jgi:putative spermidine/putrescine transport system permease protein
MFLILPILVFNIIFFFSSFIIGIFSSFGNAFYVNGWFIDNQFILFDITIIRNIIFTLKISTVSTLVSLIIALVLLFLIYNHPVTKKYFKKILYLPLLTPYLLIAFFMMYAFSTSGLFNRILYTLGLVNNLSDGLILINDLHGKGIILAYIWKTTPFILIVLINSLEHFDFRLLTIAESLGSSKLQSFLNISTVEQIWLNVRFATIWKLKKEPLWKMNLHLHF